MTVFTHQVMQNMPDIWWDPWFDSYWTLVFICWLQCRHRINTALGPICFNCSIITTAKKNMSTSVERPGDCVWLLTIMSLQHRLLELLKMVQWFIWFSILGVTIHCRIYLWVRQWVVDQSHSRQRWFCRLSCNNKLKSQNELNWRPNWFSPISETTSRLLLRKIIKTNQDSLAQFSIAISFCFTRTVQPYDFYIVDEKSWLWI